MIVSVLLLFIIITGNIIAFMSCKDNTIDTGAENNIQKINNDTENINDADADIIETPVNDLYSHGVMGKGVGINPGRVVWAHNPDSYSWNGNGYWWNINNFNYDIIQKMMDDSIKNLAGSEDIKEAWDLIFKYFNERHGKNDTGYAAGQKIVVKVNMNAMGSDIKGQTNGSFTAPIPVKALLVSLVQSAGVVPSNITVMDPSRAIPDYMQEICGTGILNGIKFLYNDGNAKNYPEMDMNFPIIWSENFEGETSYLPKCLTEADYFINFANLKGHDLAGVTLTAKNHFGTIMNSSKSNPPQAANIHGFVTAHDYSFGEGWTWKQRPMNTYSVLVDFIANINIGGKTLLYLLDAFIVAPNQSVQLSGNMKWKQPPFNDDWPSSLFVSQDPVAIDSVAVDFLMSEPTFQYYNEMKNGKMTHENYIHEAAQVNDAPSGTVYKNGAGEIVVNLGVHEHWNNSTDRQYSRNLGKDEGVELIKVE